jgi:hypothetical protein
MSTVATGTSDLDGILAAMGGSAIKSDSASLLAIVRIDWPLRLVPAALEVIGYLGKAEGEGRSGEKSCSTDHRSG